MRLPHSSNAHFLMTRSRDSAAKVILSRARHEQNALSPICSRLAGNDMPFSYPHPQNASSPISRSCESFAKTTVRRFMRELCSRAAFELNALWPIRTRLAGSSRSCSYVHP